MRRWAAAAGAALLTLVGCSSGDATAPSVAIGDAAIQSVDVAAHAGLFRQPLDAAPSPDGSVIFFVATGDAGSGIYRAPAAGGAVSSVSIGNPFVRPSGVAVATDGSRVFAADPRTTLPEGPGAIFSAPTSGGAQTPSVVPGTAGRAPRGVDVVSRPEGDVIYFTGTDPLTGSTGLFRLPAAGGTVATVAEGTPFASLDSVVVTAKGVAYVSDRGAVPGQGRVFRVDGGTATPLLTGLQLGAPAGVTLVHGDAMLLVSTLDPNTKSDQLLFLDLSSGRTAVATKGVGDGSESAGGLHRAFNAPVLAWADTNGQVFRIRPR